jgi:probable addiction module antidote protein
MFRRDPGLAVDYVNAVLKDADEAELLLALRNVSRAFGGVQAVAQLSGLNPNTLYRTFSSRGNPELRTLIAVLKVMGMRLSVQPL